MSRKLGFKNPIICKFPGCSNSFFPYRKTSVFCNNHTKYEIRYRTPKKVIKKQTKEDKIRIKREIKEKKYEENRLKAISLSPDINNLLSFSIDNGKTIIYCKNEKQLNKARELFRNLYSWKHTLTKK